MNHTSAESEVQAGEEAESAPLLTALDRCDACGAQAYVQTTLSTGPLLWCAHHYNKSETKLAGLLVELIDERWRLIQA